MALRVRVVALLLLAAMSSGCFGGDDDTNRGDDPDDTDPDDGGQGPRQPGGPGGFVDPDDPRVPLLLDFHLDGCHGFTFRQPTPISDIQELLPDGYIARPVEDVGEAAGLGGLMVELYACASFWTPNAVVNDTWIGEAYTPIFAPEWANTTDGDWRYTFQMLAGADVLAQLWALAGFDTYNGTASVQWTGAPGAAGLLEANLGGYLLNAPTGPDPGPVTAGAFHRVHLRDDGNRLYWSGTWERSADQAGQGALSVPQETPFSGLGLVTPNSLSGSFQYQASVSIIDNDLWVDLIADRDDSQM